MNECWDIDKLMKHHITEWCARRHDGAITNTRCEFFFSPSIFAFLIVTEKRKLKSEQIARRLHLLCDANPKMFHLSSFFYFIGDEIENFLHTALLSRNSNREHWTSVELNWMLENVCWIEKKWSKIIWRMQYSMKLHWILFFKLFSKLIQ